MHSSRMWMKHVTPEEFKAMDNDSLRCAAELSDARVDIMAYACLVAIMAQGPGYHHDSQKRLACAAAAAEFGNWLPVVSSAGALIEGLRHLKARKVANLQEEGIEVVDSISLEVADKPHRWTARSRWPHSPRPTPGHIAGRRPGPQRLRSDAVSVCPGRRPAALRHPGCFCCICNGVAHAE